MKQGVGYRWNEAAFKPSIIDEAGSQEKQTASNGNDFKPPLIPEAGSQEEELTFIGPDIQLPIISEGESEVEETSWSLVDFRQLFFCEA